MKSKIQHLEANLAREALQLENEKHLTVIVAKMYVIMLAMEDSGRSDKWIRRHPIMLFLAQKMRAIVDDRDHGFWQMKGTLELMMNLKYVPATKPPAQPRLVAKTKVSLGYYRFGEAMMPGVRLKKNLSGSVRRIGFDKNEKVWIRCKGPREARWRYDRGEQIRIAHREEPILSETTMSIVGERYWGQVQAVKG